MNSSLPIHRHEYLSDDGIHLKIITQDEVSHHPVYYAHRDDYYIFGIIVQGSLRCDIDFQSQTISEGELQFIKPGQVHRFIDGGNFEGWMLMTESGIVDDRYRLIFDEASIRGSSAKVDTAELHALKTLFLLMRNLLAMEVEPAVIRNLVSAFIGIVAGCFKKVCHQKSDYNRRHTEIFLQLNSMLQTHLATSHSPSFYADKLHITPAYLNEVVKNVSGWNVSNYIRNEIILQAKRMLFHTSMPVKEIAASLGFEDNAYFTRIFTKAAGKSPLHFRQNLE